MEKFSNLMNAYLDKPINVLTNQKHLYSIKMGLVQVMPIMIVGSFFLFIATLPFPSTWSIAILLKKYYDILAIPFKVSVGLLPIYAIISISSMLALEYKLDSTKCSLYSMLGYFCTLDMFSSSKSVFDILCSSSLFVSIFVAIVCVELVRVYHKYIKVRNEGLIPSVVKQSFIDLLPILLIMLFFGGITYIGHFHWHEILGDFFINVVMHLDCLVIVLVIVFLTTFFWSFGIHGISVIGLLARVFWIEMIARNGMNYLQGSTHVIIGVESLYQWFIWIGGSGCTIGLVISLCMFSNSRHLNRLARQAIIPSIFNINEPIIFGTPIVLNYILIIPFMIVPLICACIAYYVTKIGFISPIYIVVPWVLPAPIGVFMATLGDWKAVVLCIALILFSFVCYYPFFRIYDNQLVMKEKEEMKNG